MSDITRDPAAPAADASAPVLALGTHDWNAEWKALQRVRRRADVASYWDKRAPTFGTSATRNPYAERFLALAAIKPGESVLDMGCGTGALSVPLGAAGHAVTAADFSGGMLAVLQENLEAQGITSVTPKQMSWEEDWEARGVTENSHDVCLASRSITVTDLEQTLLELTSVARRRVCITLATGASPRVDERILGVAGVPYRFDRDYLYAFNILTSHGIKVEVSYISSSRDDSYESFDEAWELYARMLEDNAACIPPDKLPGARARLRPWLEDQLVENERIGQPDSKGVPGKALRLREPRSATWAFLAWNK